MTTDEQVSALMAEREELIRTKRKQLADMEAALNRSNRIATDRLYMMNAYYAMLGPIGRKVADMWSEKGVLRQHTSWGPGAEALSGEERAQVLLDAENAPKALVESVDSHLSPEATP